MLSGRRHQVLKALVQEYISTGQPVGSRHLVDRHGLCCSSATVRNELAALEEGGFVHQPHISAGRVPTDSGYRQFVDGILEVECGVAETPAPHDGDDSRPSSKCGVPAEELIATTSAALANLTHYVAVVLAPPIQISRIHKVDVVLMDARRLLLLLIFESGKVVSRHIITSEDVSPADLSGVQQWASDSLAGNTLDEARATTRLAVPESLDGGLTRRIFEEVLAVVEESERDRVHHVGIGELASLPDFAESARLRPLLGLLEDGIAMLDTLAEVMSDRGIVVRIGNENTRRELDVMSMVMTTYGASRVDGVVGVIGPKRMDYQRSIAAVRVAANDLTTKLG